MKNLKKILKQLKKDKKLYKKAIENAKELSCFYIKEQMYVILKKFNEDILKDNN